MPDKLWPSSADGGNVGRVQPRGTGHDPGTNTDAVAAAAAQGDSGDQARAEDHRIDRELIAKVAERDRAALAALYDRHATHMLGVAYRILKNRSDAEDLVHDVLLEVWNKAGSYDAGRGTVRTWLLLRTRSRGIDRIRSLQVARKHQAVQKPDADASAAASAVDPSRTPDHNRVRRALDVLSEAQRKVIELSYFRGLSCSEIATQCEIPLGTAKSRLAGAIARLRAELMPERSTA